MLKCNSHFLNLEYNLSAASGKCKKDSGDGNTNKD